MGYKAIYFAIGEKALGFLQIYSIIFQIYNKQNRVFFFFLNCLKPWHKTGMIFSNYWLHIATLEHIFFKDSCIANANSKS